MIDKIKVCVADDHTLFRNLVVEMVSKFKSCDTNVLEAENGIALLKILKTKAIDVVLLDINMPKMDGQAAAKVILNRYPNTRVIILTMIDSPGKVITFMEMGVHGYLLKSCKPEEVEKAIQEVFSFDFYKNDLSIRALRMIAKNPNLRKSELTERETEIVKLICQELTMVEIADKLSISIRTVENHRTSILRKLSVKNTVGIVKFAYETRMISISAN